MSALRKSFWAACLLVSMIHAPLTRAADDPLVSKPCVSATGLSLHQLEKEQHELEQSIASSTARGDAQSTEVSQPNGARPSPEQDVDEKRTRLIDILYQMECLRSDFERSEEVSRGSPAMLTMSLLYATNRRVKENPQIDDFYGYNDTRRLAYGATTISIPSLHKPGELELPSLWRLEWSSNSERYFQVKSVTPLDSVEAQSQIREALAHAKSKSLLLFVHGYNVSFLEASYRAAQLAYDLRFPGLTMFYSWPSAATTAGYLHDEESARLAVSIFNELLDDIASLKNCDELYIIAHSMGNRVVGDALAERVKTGKDVGKIRELMLAAPDINVEIFKSDIAPFLAKVAAARKTIYASSQDLALRASNVVHGFSRVGDTKDGVIVYPTFDTIDASAVAPLLRSFGHSYVLDSSVVLNDVEDVFVWHRPASDRILRALGTAPNGYWAIQ
jgi:esterase/lipase superfamily enzyme